MAGSCIQKDDYEKNLKELIRKTDMMVFVMLVYYCNWPAQLKTVVDRFYNFTVELTNMHKKVGLLSVAWDHTDTVFEVVQAYYQRICEYMEFENCEAILGKGCGTPTMTKHTLSP